MKRSSTILLGVLIVLILVLVISKQVEKSQVRKPVKGKKVEVDIARVDRISIIRPRGSFVFEKKAGGWYLAQPISFPAHQEFVTQLLNKVKELNIENLISDKKNKHNKFKVDSTGTQVFLMAAEDTLNSFVVGKPGSDYRHTYFRYLNSDEVLFVKGSIARFFNRNLREWRDKTIFNYAEDDIDSLKFHSREEGLLTLKFVDDNWKVQKGKEEFEAKSDVVERLLRTVADLKTNDFQDDTTQVALNYNNPDFILEVFLANGSEGRLTLFLNEGKKRYFARKSGNETLFVLYKGSANQFMKKLDDLKKKEEKKPQEESKESKE
ncbi:DUF4340 domain-containing protein [candidate division KSB1 bacterium]|nr:DUF4340 domain-containing protein [candidate division KSB1 bacterium]